MFLPNNSNCNHNNIFQLKGISTEQFIKDEQHSMKMHDCGIFGYRGLTGNNLLCINVYQQLII